MLLLKDKTFVVESVCDNMSGTQSVKLLTAWDKDECGKPAISTNGSIALIFNDKADMGLLKVGQNYFVDFCDVEDNKVEALLKKPFIAEEVSNNISGKQSVRFIATWLKGDGDAESRISLNGNIYLLFDRKEDMGLFKEGKEYFLQFKGVE